MFKKIWGDPVWSKVIGGIITVSILASFGFFATHLWPGVRQFLKSSTEVPNWVFPATAAVAAVALIYLVAKVTTEGQHRQSPSAASSVAEHSSPKIEIHHQPNSPYEVSEIQHNHVLSTVRIGIANSGSGAFSNCKVYIDKISPEPALPGGLPILLDGAGFSLRHDDPEKLVDIAAHWDHANKFRFSAPIGGAFAETLSYIESKQPLTIMIKVVATECQRCASFKMWADEAKAMHLAFISYVS